MPFAVGQVGYLLHDLVLVGLVAQSDLLLNDITDTVQSVVEVVEESIYILHEHSQVIGVIEESLKLIVMVELPYGDRQMDSGRRPKAGEIFLVMSLPVSVEDFV